MFETLSKRLRLYFILFILPYYFYFSQAIKFTIFTKFHFYKKFQNKNFACKHYEDEIKRYPK